MFNLILRIILATCAILLMALMTSISSKAQECDALSAAYGNIETETIRQVYEHPSSRLQYLHALYRLYPLTEDKQLLDDIPSDLGSDAPAGEMALLSALWTWRGSRASLFRKLPMIMKGVRMLDRARQVDSEDPLVQLVYGQSLIFKPKIAGGDFRKALTAMRYLRQQLEVNPTCEVSIPEVDSWIYYCLHLLNDPEEDRFKQTYLQSNPPRLFRGFVLSPEKARE